LLACCAVGVALGSLPSFNRLEGAGSYPIINER
jgi:hypothetical protein